MRAFVLTYIWHALFAVESIVMGNPTLFEVLYETSSSSVPSQGAKLLTGVHAVLRSSGFNVLGDENGLPSYIAQYGDEGNAEITYTKGETLLLLTAVTLGEKLLLNAKLERDVDGKAHFVELTIRDFVDSPEKPLKNVDVLEKTMMESFPFLVSGERAEESSSSGGAQTSVSGQQGQRGEGGSASGEPGFRTGLPEWHEEGPNRGWPRTFPQPGPGGLVGKECAYSVVQDLE